MPSAFSTASSSNRELKGSMSDTKDHLVYHMWAVHASHNMRTMLGAIICTVLNASSGVSAVQAMSNSAMGSSNAGCIK